MKTLLVIILSLVCSMTFGEDKPSQFAILFSNPTDNAGKIAKDLAWSKGLGNGAATFLTFGGIYLAYGSLVPFDGAVNNNGTIDLNSAKFSDSALAFAVAGVSFALAGIFSFVANAITQDALELMSRPNAQ